MLIGAPLAACSSDGPTEVPLERVRVGTVDEIVRVPARIEATRVLPVSTPAPGTVVELLVSNGDQVVAGQPVLRIDSPLVDQLLAQTATAAPGLALCGGGSSLPSPAGGPPATAALDELEGAFGEVLASMGRAQETLLTGLPAAPELPPLPDFSSLPGQPQPPAVPATPGQPQLPAVPEPPGGPAPEAVVELIGPVLDQARAQVETSRLTLERATAELSAGAQHAAAALETALASTRASVAAAQRSASEAQQMARSLIDSVACGPTVERSVMLDDIKQRLLVRAPADGVVVLGAPPSAGPALPTGGADALLGDLSSLFAGTNSTRLAVGSTVGIGQTLFTLYDVSGFLAVADFDEGQAAELFEGARATVVVDSAEETLEGVLTFVSPVPTGGGDQPAYRGEVALEVPTGEVTAAASGASQPRLAVGMTAQLDVHLRSVGPATIVPESALIRDGATTFMYVVADGRAAARTVRVLGSDGTRAAVEGDDVEPTDRVVLTPRSVDDGEELRA